MSLEHPAFEDVVAGYGKMTILQRHHFARSGAARSRPSSARTAPASRPCSRRSSACCRCAAGRIVFDGRDITNFAPRAAARRRHLLRAAGPQHLSRAVRAPQSRARRRRARRPGVDLAARIEAVMDRFPMLREQGRRAGLDALRRPAEAARGRARPAARSQADADRRAVDRAVADPGAGGVRASCRTCANSGVTDPDDRAERQAARCEISDYGLVLEQGRRASQDTAPSDPRRSAHRPAVPRRRPAAETEKAR